MKTKLLVLFLTTLIGCKDTEKEHLTRLVTEWQGKEIQFPTDPVFTTLASDTVDYHISPSRHKVLVYVDSLGCTSCKLQLDRWKTLISFTDSATNRSVPFLFFFYSKDYREIRYLLKLSNIDALANGELIPGGYNTVSHPITLTLAMMEVQEFLPVVQGKANECAYNLKFDGVASI